MKLSIIVPVYNVAKYLPRCLDSLVNQKIDYDYEIIIVNDGSTDESGEICDFYNERYKNIKLIHQNNQGLAGARNTALQYVQGQYIGFVDSDDWINEKMYQQLIEVIESEKADIAACSFNKYNWNKIPMGGGDA